MPPGPVPTRLLLILGHLPPARGVGNSNGKEPPYRKKRRVSPGLSEGPGNLLSIFS